MAGRVPARALTWCLASTDDRQLVGYLCWILPGLPVLVCVTWRFMYVWEFWKGHPSVNLRYWHFQMGRNDTSLSTQSVVNSTDCGFQMSPWSSSSHLSPTIEFFVSPLPNQKMTGHSFRLKFLWKERKWNMWVRLGTGEQQRHLAYSARDFRRLWNVLAAAAKSLQSCPTLCNPIDGSPSGSSVPGILQARILEWVDISFSIGRYFSSVQFSCSGVWLFVTPWTACSTPGLPVHHQLPEFTQIHVHWIGDALQPTHPLLSPSPPAPNPSQHQGLFQWVNSSHEVAKVLEFQLQATQ